MKLQVGVEKDHPFRSGKLLGAFGLAVLAYLLRSPYFYLFSLTPVPAVIVATVVGFGSRWRVLDAILFASAHIAAEFLVEPVVGPQALACLSLGLLALSGRPRFSLFLGSALLALFLVIVRLKYQFAGSVFTSQDVRYFFAQFNDNIGVMASQPTLLIYSGLAIFALAVMMVITWRLDRSIAGVERRQVRNMRYASRAIACGTAFWFVLPMGEAGERLSRMSVWRISEVHLNQPISTFLSTIYLKPVPLYQKTDTQHFAHDVQGLSAQVASVSRPADIVVFLQESQFNPLAIQGCPQQVCGSSLFDVAASTTDRGELRVHVHGSGTWLSEFAFATGLPHTFFGRAGDFAPFNVAPGITRSFIRSLKAAGYYTVAVYPVRGGMMNARMAYRGYGFDEFLDAEQVGLPGGYDTPDHSVHEAAVKTLNGAYKHGKPVFLFAVTIFNHSEHGRNMARVPAEIVGATNQLVGTPTERANLADYVWRTREFERAYNRTRDEILSAERPAVVAWFGDHQPPFGNAPGIQGHIGSIAKTSSVSDSKYLTWYNVASNLNPHASGLMPAQLDIAFLPGLLAQRAGVQLDDWLAANILARERCGGLLQECTNASDRDAYLTYLFQDLGVVR